MITVRPLSSSVLAQFSVDGIPDRRHSWKSSVRNSAAAATASVLASPFVRHANPFTTLFLPEAPRRGIIEAGLGVFFRPGLIVTRIYPSDL